MIRRRDTGWSNILLEWSYHSKYRGQSACSSSVRFKLPLTKPYWYLMNKQGLLVLMQIQLTNQVKVENLSRSSLISSFHEMGSRNRQEEGRTWDRTMKKQRSPCGAATLHHGCFELDASLLWEAVLCVVGCLAASLALIHQMQVVSALQPPSKVVEMKNVSRCCQISLGSQNVAKSSLAAKITPSWELQYKKVNVCMSDCHQTPQPFIAFLPMERIQ